MLVVLEIMPMKIVKTIIFFSVIYSSSIFACSVPSGLSTAEKFDEAEHVFVAKIISANLVMYESAEFKWEKEVVVAKYELIEQFKGNSNPPIVREGVFGPGNCMMGLLVGNNYFFFLDNSERYAGWPAGSFMTWNLEGEQAIAFLEELRGLSNELQNSN